MKQNTLIDEKYSFAVPSIKTFKKYIISLEWGF